MKKEIKPLQVITTMICLLSLLALFSCAPAKIVYFNDSDKVYAGNMGDSVIAQYPYVIMSKGTFRDMTNISLEPGVYICTKQ